MPPPSKQNQTKFYNKIHSREVKSEIFCIYCRALVLVLLGCGLCQAEWQNRQLLTGFSSAHDLMTEHGADVVAPTQSMLQIPQAKTQRLTNFESEDADHHRRLMQFSRVPAPAPSPVSFNQQGKFLTKKNLGKLLTLYNMGTDCIITQFLYPECHAIRELESIACSCLPEISSFTSSILP